jgi:4-hydroxybenzoyl-CoA reductase subunit beta
VTTVRPVEDLLLLRPATLSEAAALLARHDARLVAGGTDLLPNLRRGLLDPSCLVDLSAVTDFDRIERGDGTWRIGAGVTLTVLARQAEVAAALPALVQAAGQVAGPGHRSAATLGGNLCQDTRCVYYNQSAWWRAANGGCLKLAGDICHVAPQGKRCHAAFEGDLAPVLLAYDAKVEVVSAQGSRRMPLADLYRDDGAAHLTLDPHEIVAAVHIPNGARGRASAYRKARVRDAMDFPLAGVAVVLRKDGQVLAELAVGISGTNSHPLRLQGTDALLGRPVDDALLLALSKLVQKQVTPMRSTVTQSNYRRLVAAATAQRLVRELTSSA